MHANSNLDGSNHHEVQKSIPVCTDAQLPTTDQENVGSKLVLDSLVDPISLVDGSNPDSPAETSKGEDSGVDGSNLL